MLLASFNFGRKEGSVNVPLRRRLEFHSLFTMSWSAENAIFLRDTSRHSLGSSAVLSWKPLEFVNEKLESRSVSSP